jgi:hypothetical protein
MKRNIITIAEYLGSLGLIAFTLMNKKKRTAKQL